MKYKSLILFTSSFPFGFGEHFIKTELTFLASSFERVYIFPYHYGGSLEPRKGLPANVIVNKPFRDERHNFIKLLLKGSISLKKLFPYLIDIVKHTEILINWNKFTLWIRSILNCRMILQDKRLINCISQNIDGLIFYFYWGNRPSGIVAGLKKYACPLIVRFHRVDLYKELKTNRNYIPFQELVIKNASQIVTISDHGKNYILNNFKIPSSKIYVHRLGTNDLGSNFLEPSSVLRIVTCSSVDYNKRVLQIAQALGGVDFQISWTHIGDGPLMPDLLVFCNSLNKTNVRIDIKGSLSNKEVHDTYKSTPFDLFVNLSRSEGVPFSIMEALSYSIPVMATAVGGTPEIVDQTCGQLLPEDISADEFRQHLKEFYLLNAEDRNTLRQNARKRWDERCNAEKNYTLFVSFLMGL